MRNIGSNTNVNFVESSIVPQLLCKEGCVGIKEHLKRMLKCETEKYPRRFLVCIRYSGSLDVAVR